MSISAFLYSLFQMIEDIMKYDFLISSKCYITIDSFAIIVDRPFIIMVLTAEEN